MCTKHVISDILFGVPLRELTICLHFIRFQSEFMDKCRKVQFDDLKMQNKHPVFWNTAI